MYRSPRDGERPCECVLKRIFNACYRRFRFCLKCQHWIATAHPEPHGSPIFKLTNQRRYEDYIADFCLVSRRALHPADYAIFRYHFLLGADQSLCSRFLGIEKLAFFRRVAEIKERLGRVYRELEPYPLYPLDEYFGGAVRQSQIAARILRRARRRREIDPPLPKIA